MSSGEQLRGFWAHKRFGVLAAALAFPVHASSLGAGYLLDDHLHRYFAQGQNIPGASRGPWDLYRFADGGAGVREAIDSGLHPWWTSPDLKLAFLRPIASLLRVAEEQLFGANAFFPHLISVLLFMATVLVVHAVFRRWLGGAAAGLATLLFAVDDAHATTVTWIAGRHGLLATFGAALALALLLRARDRKAVSLGSGVAFLAALLSSEAAVSALAFFAALTLFDDPRPLRERLVSLAPIGAATTLWLVLYRALGCGSGGSAFYIDPLSHPLRFAEAAALRLPALGLAQLFLPPSELSSMQSHLAPAIAVMGAAVLALTFVLVWRTKERARALGLFVGFVVSLIPACGTNADDRLLVLPGVAAMGLVGLGCRAAWHARRKFGARAFLVMVAVVHVGLAVPLGPLRSSFFAQAMAHYVDGGAESLFADPNIAQKHMVMVTSPDGLLPSSMFLSQKLSGKPVFQSGKILATSPAGEVSLTRVDALTLRIHASGGMMHDPFVGAVRAAPFRAGDRVVLPHMTVSVVEASAEGSPTQLEFAFAEALEGDDLAFVAWREGRYRPFALPPVGATVKLEAIDFAETLAAQ